MRPTRLDGLRALTQPPIPLQPGDVLLYHTPGFAGWWIRWKTWSDVNHVETYVGDGRSVASRDGVGVGTYALRLDGLRYVLRPRTPFDLAAALAWQARVDGQRYDFVGLLVFYLAVAHGARDRMFCSEHATRFARHGAVAPFEAHFDADHVAPATFKTSAAYWRAWSADAAAAPPTIGSTPEYV